MFLNMKHGYTESLDYTTLPEYARLDVAQRAKVQEVYYYAYHGAIGNGLKHAMSKAHESAKVAIAEALQPAPAITEEAPRSIFYGLENCS
jgi:hypothetical protein